MGKVLLKVFIFLLIITLGVLSPFSFGPSTSVSAARKPKPVPPPINTNIQWGLVETPGMGWDQAGHQDGLSIGVKTTRIELRLVDDVSQFDTQFIQAAQDGIKLMPLLNTAAATYNVYPDPSAFAQFTANMAAQYGAAGTFWTAHPELNGALAPDAFEMINEPDIFIEKDITLGGPQKYANIVKASVNAGRAANPNPKYIIYGGGTVNDNGVQWVDYMFSAVPDLGNYVDYINAHPYLGIDRIIHARDAFIKHGVTRDVWITEVGGNVGPTWSESAQATWITDWGNTVKSYAWIRSFYYFQYRDWTTECTSPDHGCYGLWRYDRSARPAASSYAKVISG